MSTAQPDVAGTVFDDPIPELTRVYADAFLGAAIKAGSPADAVDELEAFAAEVWRAHPEFASLLNSPSVDAQQRDTILARSLEGHASDHLTHFLRVLNRHGRLELIGSVARRVRVEWDRRQGRKPVRVRSAVPLTTEQESRLRERLGTMLQGATPVVHYEVDPSLIGGLVVQVGDQVFDASVRTRYLDGLRTRLIDGSSHEVLARRDTFTAA
jgi:F-type H+-transporting ATPase subunit delta